MFTSRTILLWGFLILGVGNGKWSPSTASAVSLSKALGQGSTCSSDEECKINYFCGGKSGNRCIECYDCAKVQRQPKRGYDGKVCAHSSIECGSCITGFDEFGGVCIPRLQHLIGQSHKMSIVDATSELSSILSNEDIIKEKLSTINWIVAGAVIVLVLGAIIAIIIRRRCRSTQETGLFSDQKDDKTDETQLASAPPEEYHQQLAYLPPAFNYHRNYNRLQQARPFNAGNGAGNWNVTNDDGDDVVDGGYEDDFVVPQMPPVQLPPVHTSAAGGTTQNTPQHQGTQNAGTQSNGIPSVEPVSQDLALGHFSFQAFAWIHGNGNNFGTGATGGNGVNHGDNSGAQFTTTCRSAPVSPRRIDDTCFDSVLSLNNSFTPSRSNASIDSGTGGSEAGHVLSHSGSGSELQGMSDEDMSMYDDMFSESFFSQASGSAPGAHRLLQLENMELD